MKKTILAFVLAMASAASVHSQSVTPPSGLVSWWQAEGNANDIYGTNNGVASGITYAAGEVGQALVFSGSSSSYVRIPASSTLDVGQSNGFTLELWCNPATTNASGAGVMTVAEWNNSSGTGASSGIGCDFEFYNGGQILFGLDDASGNLRVIASAYGIVVPNVWQHVAVTYDKTSGMLALYRNGVVLTNWNAGTLMPSTAMDLFLGKRAAGPAAPIPYQGSLDEVSLYNRALSGTEIQAIYNAGSAGKTFTSVPPGITMQPVSQTNQAGTTASFSVTATGSTPLRYQWSFNGTNLNNATNTTLTLTNVQPSQSGNYLVTVTNLYGSTNSSVAVFVVTPLVSIAPPSGLVSWWQGEGNASDSMGTNNGLATGMTYAAGEVGQALVFSGSSSSYVKIPASATLDVGRSNGFTLEFWCNPATTNASGAGVMTVAEWNNSSGTGANSGIGPHLDFYNGGSIIFALSDASLGDYDIVSAYGNVTPNVWQHLAVTYDKTSGLLTLYRNGVMLTNGNAGLRTPYTSMDLFFGKRSAGVFAPIPYQGSLDEVSLYNRALSGTEIQAIYNAGSAGKTFTPIPPTIPLQPASQTNNAGTTVNFTVTATGTAPLSYQWCFNGTNLNNATNTTLTLANVQPSQAGNYMVTVTNAYGSTNSLVAVLTVLTYPPSITLQPASQTNNAGTTVSFTVTATGTSPVGYQWSFNGTNLNNATNTTLTLTNVQPVNAGVYLVTVTNIYGLANSSNALLTVLTFPPVITTQPVSQTNLAGMTVSFTLAASGTAPLSYQWSFNGTNLNNATNTTLILTNVQPGQSGNYLATITNIAGSTNSLVAILKVNSPVSITPPSGLVSWWQGEGNASDSMGTNNGLATGITYAAGEVKQAFVFAGSSSSYVKVPASSSLDVGQSNGFTLELWCNPATTNGSSSVQMVAEWNKNTDGPGTVNGVGCQLAFYNGGAIEGALVDANTITQYTLVSSGGNVTPNMWQHIVMTYDKTTGVLALYRNGALLTNSNIGNHRPSTVFDLYFGKRVAGIAYPISYQGALDEVSLYNRALSGSEIQAIYNSGSLGKYLPPSITLQPVSQTNNAGATVNFSVVATGTSPLSYQWSFNGTNLNNATNTTLTLANVQPNQAGNYMVTVTNAYGSTNSSVAALTVLTYPPSITLQPVSQTNLAGMTVSFSVAATGTSPLSYQWSFNGTNLNNATNTTLTLTNVQPGQSGNYLVTVTNIAGSTNSTVAMLKINPPVSIIPPSGLVSWWKGEGNANDSMGINNGIAQSVTYANGEVGQAFVFSGANSYVSIPDSPSLHNITTNLTFELWMKHAPISGGDWQGIVTKGDCWALQTDSDNTAHLGVSGLSTTYLPGTRTICDGNWHHVAVVYDGTNIYIYVDGTLDVKQPATGSITQTGDPLCFGANSQAYVPSCSCNELGYFYTGSIDEVSLYNRALSGSEIQTIYNSGSLGKYLPPSITLQPVSQTNNAGATVNFSVAATGTAPLSYQWSFNGTNLNNATNMTLTLTNVQLSQSGNYLVTVANPYASTNSYTAVLMVGLPPTITQQPQSRSVLSYNAVSFTVAVSGTDPLNYQWRKNGTNLVDGSNISGSTTTSLNLASVSPSDAGNYDVVVSNPYATSNSAVAVLTVPQTTVTIGSTNAMSGSTIVVPVMMNALGMEYAFFGSVGYDPTKLTLKGVQLGQATAGAYLQEVDTQTNNGYVGFAIILNFGDTIPAGTQEVANLVFQTLPVTSNTNVNLTFGDTPTGRQIVDNNLTLWPTIYQNGTVSLAPAEYAADVYPRTNGDHQVIGQDWLEVGRMVAKIDVVTNSDEMLRADCAPRNNPNGKLTVADWVQAGRYALGLDPLTLVTTPSHKALTLSTPKLGIGGTRTLQIGNVAALRGQAVNVPVQLISTTDENAVGMTVRYNTNQLKLIGVALGSATMTGRLNVNSNQLTGGVGVALSLPPGAALSPGTNEIVVFNFMTSSNASGSSPLTLDDSVVSVEVADKAANVLTANYVNGAVVLPLQPTIVTTATGTNLQLTWPVATGNFQVQVASNLFGPWATIVIPMITNGGNVTATVPPSGFQQIYYRLTGQ